MRVRQVSKSTGIAVDCWYGINASTSADLTSSPLHRVPADLDAATDTRAMRKLTEVLRQSETVMIFDGLFMNHMGINANRVNARHASQTKTNLLFFDGHAKTYETAYLPGGLPKAAVTDFSVANLNKNYQAPAPRWRLDQD